MNRSPSALVIAYHYPPIAVSSGVHRMVSLTNTLAEAGWRVSVLSVPESLYERTDLTSLTSIDSRIRVIRARAYDAASHLSVKGRYLRRMALPDRLQSWILFGVIRALREMHCRRPDVILSTYPIASAHVIALVLHRLTGIPWVADFRDPMAQDGYPADPAQWRAFDWVERQAANHATRLVFATPGAMAEYQNRYPNVETQRWAMIPNGYEESQYADLQPSRRNDGEFIILHAGLIYPKERNPSHLFAALGQLRREGFFRTRRARFLLRATGHDDQYRKMLLAEKLEGVVRLEPAIPYREALTEMFSVDGLLLLQGSDCNQQIPAKAYEYLRAQKPVLALTDPAGDTGQLLRDNGVAQIVNLDDVAGIREAVMALIGQLENGDWEMPAQQKLEQYARSAISQRYVQLIERCLVGEEGVYEMEP